MPLEKKFIRDGRNRLVGSVTSGYSDTTEIVRDAEGGLLEKPIANSRTRGMPTADW